MRLSDISVIITSYNEAVNVGRCLDWLDGFGEIVLIDSFSSDETLDIARRYSAVIYTRPYRSAAKQKNWALGRVRSPWVLILDADEALTVTLKREIEAIDSNGHIDGYWIRRRSEYLGRLIRYCGWQRDKVLRLFRVGHGRYHEREVHEEVQVDGDVSILTNSLVHYPYRSVEDHLKKIEEYSNRGAKDYVANDGRFAFVNMLIHPPFRFVRMYFLQRGILDGSRGFILCLLSSYGVFLKYAKAWELSRVRVDT